MNDYCCSLLSDHPTNAGCPTVHVPRHWPMGWYDMLKLYEWPATHAAVALPRPPSVNTSCAKSPSSPPPPPALPARTAFHGMLSLDIPQQPLSLSRSNCLILRGTNTNLVGIASFSPHQPIFPGQSIKKLKALSPTPLPPTQTCTTRFRYIVPFKFGTIPWLPWHATDLLGPVCSVRASRDLLLPECFEDAPPLRDGPLLSPSGGMFSWRLPRSCSKRKHASAEYWNIWIRGSGQIKREGQVLRWCMTFRSPGMAAVVTIVTRLVCPLWLIEWLLYSIHAVKWKWKSNAFRHVVTN